MPASDVEQITDCLQLKADSLNYDDVEGLETFVEKWSHLLHPNNSILVGIKYYLCLLYGNTPGYMLDEIPDELIEHKIDLCKDLLAIADVLEPGYSKLSGNVWFPIALDCSAFLNGPIGAFCIGR